MPRWRALKAAVISRRLRKVSPGEGANKDTLVALSDLETFVARFPGDEWRWLREFSDEWRGMRRDEAIAKPSTAGAESRTKAWLTDLMKRRDPEASKADYLAEAKQRFGVGERAFGRAWANAVVDSENHAWTKPGRKRRRKS
jgi:hypothetical protein